MRRFLWGTCLVLLATGLQAQQPGPRPTPVLGRAAAPKAEMLQIYQIDLVPSGSAFGLNKPVLDGDVYVFKVWPEGDVVRLPKARVRQISQRTKELEKFVVYQIDLQPSGRMLAKENPTLKNKSYVFHTWKEGKLMTLRQSDVKQITLLQGLPAFKAQQEEKGAALIGNLPMEGGGSVTYFNEPPPAPVNPADTAAPAPGNWNYDGTPGATDAYAPANATVAHPGDVPKAPDPTPPPR